MALWPQCRIVDRPDQDATVLVDLASGVRETTWLRHASAGFSLGEPSWTNGPDGQIIEGTRQIDLPVMIDGHTSSRHAQQAQIMRALSRQHRSTFLQWQLNPQAEPTWFRLHDAHKSQMDWSRTFALDKPGVPKSTTVLPVTLTADGWGIGGKVTLPPTTIAASDWQQSQLVGEGYDGLIRGTAPAPWVCDVDPDLSWSNWRQSLNVTAVQPGSPYMAAYQWYSSRFTAADHTTRDDSAIYFDESGPGFASASGGLVAWGEPPDPVVPGTYRIYVQMAHGENALGGGWLKAGRSTFGAEFLGPWVPWKYQAKDDPSWVDCGIISLPAGVGATESTAESGMTQPALSLWFRASADNDGVDHAYAFRSLLLVPAGPVQGAAGPPTTTRITGLGASTHRIDSESRRAGYIQAGKWVGSPLMPPRVEGGWPVLYPGARNYVSVLHRINPDSAARTDGTTMDDYHVTISGYYRPRWHHLASSQ